METEAGDIHHGTIPGSGRSPSISSDLKQSESLGTEELDPASSRTSEWVPTMLRKGPATSFAFLLAALIVLLEVLHYRNRTRGGFSTDWRVFVIATQYLPTITAILVASIWKQLVWDMKKMTPWAAITGRWVTAQDSLLINYADEIELWSLWTSCRRKHWGLFIGLVGGFFGGAALLFTSDIFYVNPSHTITFPETLLGTSSLNVNESLWLRDDIPVDQLSASILGSRRFHAPLPRWTSDEYAYQSFNLSSSSLRNATISANVLAFGADLDCFPITYDVNMTQPWQQPLSLRGAPNQTVRTTIRISPKKYDLAQSDCAIPRSEFALANFRRPPIGSELTYQPPAAWMDLMRCGDTKSLLSLTIIELLTGANDYSADWDHFRATGLLCRPRFTVHSVRLTVNATTAVIVEARKNNGGSEDIDMGVNVAALVRKINRPEAKNLFLEDDLRLLLLEALVGVDEARPDQARPHQTRPDLLNKFLIDPWFYMLSRGNISVITKYGEDTNKLAEDSTRLFKAIMAQIISYQSRNEERLPMPGWVNVSEPRVLMRESSLRMLEAILVFLAISILLGSTVLRPRTILIEDPALVGAVAVVTSASHPLEAAFSNSGLLGDAALRKMLADVKVRLVLGSRKQPLLEMSHSAPEESSRMMEPDSQADKFETKNSGYRPVVLHVASRSSLLAVLIAFIIALGVLLVISRSNNGLAGRTSASYLAWSYVPVAMLVLLGYALQGVDAAIQSLQPYLALRKGLATARKTMLFNPRNYSVFVLAYRSLRQAASWALFASTVTVLIYPAVNVAVAGLYTQSLVLTSSNVLLDVDQTLITNFDGLNQHAIEQEDYQDVFRSAMREASYQLTTWTERRGFNFPAPPGALGSFVFSNVTVHASNEHHEAIDQGAPILTRVPAIEVDVTCTEYDKSAFEFTADQQANVTGHSLVLLTINCTAEKCEDHFMTMGTSWAHITSLELPSGNSNHRYVSFLRVLPDTSISLLFAKLGWLEYAGPNSTLPITLTAVAGVTCSRRFKRVEVNVTIARQVQANLRSTPRLPLAVTAYDQSSATEAVEREPYDLDSTAWIRPSADRAVEQIDSSDWAGLISGSAESAALGWFRGILVDRELSERGNADGLLDPTHLVEATRQTYTAFCSNVINQLRPLAAQNLSVPLKRNATVTTQSMRVYQDATTTFVIQVILAVIFLCVLLTLWRIPANAVVPKAPESIGAQISMLAGSNLVRILREQHVRSVIDTSLWDELRFSLTSWPSNRPTSGQTKERWGIDIDQAKEAMMFL